MHDLEDIATCICGWDLGEPEYGDLWKDWETCPNCDRYLYTLVGDKRRANEREALLRVARAAMAAYSCAKEDYYDRMTERFPQEFVDLADALKEVEDLL